VIRRNGRGRVCNICGIKPRVDFRVFKPGLYFGVANPKHLNRSLSTPRADRKIYQPTTYIRARGRGGVKPGHLAKSGSVRLPTG